MKNSIIAANWKSNKTKNEAKNWLDDFSKTEIPQDAEVILFVPFTLLDFVSSFVSEKGLRVKVGAQNVSQFDLGPYTGEINVAQIKEFADYVLIGHSERRENFQEDQLTIKKKVEKSLSAELIPVICISEFDQARELEFARDALFAFEPLSAIGTENPEDVGTVSEFSQKFNATFDNQLIYGGSINPENMQKYLKIPGISGVLVGSESLSSESFSQMVKNA